MSIKTQKNTGKNGFNRQNLKVKDKSNNPEHTEKQDFENLEELKKIEVNHKTIFCRQRHNPSPQKQGRLFSP